VAYDEKYPTMEEVEAADRQTICRWYRFLPSPGLNQKAIMNRICERFKDMGGFNAEISKSLGWGN